MIQFQASTLLLSLKSSKNHKKRKINCWEKEVVKNMKFHRPATREKTAKKV